MNWIQKFAFWLLKENRPNDTFTSGMKAPYSGVFYAGKEYIPLTKGERFPPTQIYWETLIKL